MSHSLRAKIKGLQYKGIITDKDCDRLCKALDNEGVLDKIRAEIEQAADKKFQIAMGVADLNERYTHIQMENAYRHSINIIDKYKEESKVSNMTLDEAIEYYKECEQLAAWLRELKNARETLHAMYGRIGYP